MLVRGPVRESPLGDAITGPDAANLSPRTGDDGEDLTVRHAFVVSLPYQSTGANEKVTNVYPSSPRVLRSSNRERASVPEARSHFELPVDMMQQEAKVEKLRDARVRDVSMEIVERLHAAGVHEAYGLLGGGGHPFFEALLASPIDILHFRHEAGAVFAAMESWFAGARPVLVFTTTGPGLTNALTGVAAARRDGAKLVLVSAATTATRRGRWAFQETSAWSLGDVNLFSPGHLFDVAARIESADELPAILARIDAGLASRGRFVAHLSLSPDVQAATVPEHDAPVGRLRSISTPAASDEAVLEICEQIEGRDVLLWVGFGAREAWREVRAFATATGARVVCTPRAKGIVSEHDPAFVGVTGLGGDRSVASEIARRPPAVTMVLGTRLGEMSSFWREDLVPRETFIHVDLDPDAIGTAYPHASVLGVVADIGDLLRRLTPRVRGPREVLAPEVTPPRAIVPPDPRRAPGTVRPAALMHAIQRVVVEGTEAIVLTEAGSAFVWGSQALRFAQPGRYRVSMGFGSMGHATTGVLGSVRGSGEPAVAIVGDGALLMNNEINTAVAYGIPAVWVVLNDGGFGLVDHGMRSLGFSPANLRIPRCDFAAVARAMGAQGERVEHETDLEGALTRALRSGAPSVVDVWVDPAEPSPFGERGASLRAQLREPPAGGRSK